LIEQILREKNWVVMSSGAGGAIKLLRRRGKESK